MESARWIVALVCVTTVAAAIADTADALKSTDATVAGAAMGRLTAGGEKSLKEIRMVFAGLRGAGDREARDRCREVTAGIRVDALRKWTVGLCPALEKRCDWAGIRHLLRWTPGLASEEDARIAFCRVTRNIEGWTEADGIKVLTALCRDKSPAVRRAAIQALDRADWRGRQATASLTALLKDKDELVRTDAAARLAARGNRAGLPVIFRSAHSENRDVTLIAFRVIASLIERRDDGECPRFAPHTPEEVKGLIGLLKVGDWAPRGTAIRILGMTRDPSAIEPLLGQLRVEPHQKNVRRIADVMAAARYRPAAAVLAGFFGRKLHRRRRNYNWTVGADWGDIGDPDSVPAVIAMLSSKDKHIVSAAASALGYAFGGRDVMGQPDLRKPPASRVVPTPEGKLIRVAAAGAPKGTALHSLWKDYWDRRKDTCEWSAEKHTLRTAVEIADAPSKAEPERTGDGRPAWVKTVLQGDCFPPVKVRNGQIHRPGRFVVRGASVVWDPVNREALVLGGHCGGVDSGSIGNWRVKDEGKTWIELAPKSKVLDPLRVRCAVARMPVRDSENAARNIFHSGLDGPKETGALCGRPAQLLTEGAGLARWALNAVRAARATGWQQEGVKHALPLLETAVERLESARAGFAAGKVDAALLAACFEGQWKLDEAADCLTAGPRARSRSSVVYDPGSRSFVLFGGDHGDYVLNDTWIYSCAKQAWRRVWPDTAPPARAGARFRRNEADGKLVLSGGQTVINRLRWQVGYMPASKGEWVFDIKSGQWAGPARVAPGTRAYRTVCSYHDPRWYDSESKGSVAEAKTWHDALPPNKWIAVPAPRGKRIMSSQAWATAVLDPGRDRIYYWSGGHEADVTDVLPTYHIAVNRWSIGYVPAYLGKGLSFDGRPDCANHTYKHYAYDPISRKVVMFHAGGTTVYNPDRADYGYTIAGPGDVPNYESALITTPKGLYLWTAGRMRRFDVAARKWTELKPVGRVPVPAWDNFSVTYDSKRDAFWMTSSDGLPNRDGQNLWRYDRRTGIVEPRRPAGFDTVGSKAGGVRESVYLPGEDLVLLGTFVGGRQVAYDPEQDAWITVNIVRSGREAAKHVGTVGAGGMLYDQKRSMLWYTATYSKMFALKLDLKTLRP